MVPLPDLSIRQFEYLIAVSEAPTWATAADAVGVTPSALSQGLAELERRLGIDLFERDGRRRRLRPTAQPVVDHARRVLALTSDLARWSAHVRSGATGRVRVGMIDAAAVLHFPDELGDFRRDHPDVDLHLTVAPSARLLEQLVAGSIDLVVCVASPDAPAGLQVEPLMPDELYVYAPDGVVPDDPGEWGPWVLFPADSHTRRLIVDALAQAGASLDVVAESHQPDVLREMVRLGMGWTVLPGAQAERGEQRLDGGIRLITRQLVLARRADSLVDPAVDVLAAALCAAAATTADDH
jgi:DNA-binding transcriptional LysR family regulator